MINLPNDQLIALLTEKANRYTHAESTSLPYHKARQLMASLLFCLDEGLNSGENLISHSVLPVKEIYQLGFHRKQEKLLSAKALFAEIQPIFDSYGLLCYEDTVCKGMPQFFSHYDLEFDGQNALLTLDYPLLNPISGLLGVDLIHEYLNRTLKEQRFLSAFPRSAVIRTLKEYHPQYTELIENTASIVLQKALGCTSAGSSASALHLDGEGQYRLGQIITQQNQSELERAFRVGLLKLLRELGINSNDWPYFTRPVKSLVKTAKLLYG